MNSSQRFTIDGSAALEKQVEQLCRTALCSVEKVVGERLDGMLLGGGYGRGEGGVLRTSSGDLPYNDLEFYVFLKGPLWANERRYQPALHHGGLEITTEAGIDVEFRVCSFSKLRRSAPSMFYYDLLMGHRWIFGNEDLLRGCEHHLCAPAIPLAESTRLLMNRCTGLLLAKERLARREFSAEDGDFVGRNIAKAQLGLGDVVLAVTRQYHWSCRQRGLRLQREALQMPWFESLKEAHCEGVRFKLHPRRDRSPPALLRSAHDQVSQLALEVWLWLESRRFGRAFGAPREYSSWPADKCPEVPAWRSLLVNLKNGGRSSARKMFRYPRDRVLNCLPLLLWCWSNPPEPAVLRCLQRELNTGESSFSALHDAYLELWRQCS